MVRRCCVTYLPDEPVIVLTASDARILWQAARLNELRLKNRTLNNRLYALLLNIYRVGLAGPNAAPGNEPRQSVASEEREYWTVRQVARGVELAERTVRLDIERNELPATKPAGSWLIPAADAKTYIARRRK